MGSNVQITYWISVMICSVIIAVAFGYAAYKIGKISDSATRIEKQLIEIMKDKK